MTVRASSPPTTTAPSRAVLPVILLAQFVIPLSIAGTAVGLPAISVELGAEPVLLQGIVNGFNLAFAVCTLMWGAIADRIGPGRAFFFGVLAVVLGSILSAASPSLLVLDVARVLAGIGSAAVITGATATIHSAFEGPSRARAFAAFGMVNGLGLAAGPSLSGVLIGLLGWRAVFVVHAVVLLAALAGSRALRRLPRTALASGSRLFDVGLLRNPGFLAMVLIPVAGAVGFVTFLTYLPAALQAIHGFTAGGAGTLMLVMTLPVLLAPPLVHRVRARHPRIDAGVVSLAALVCLVLAAAGFFALRPEVPVWWTVLPMILAGAGFGLPLGVVDGSALSFVPAERSGTAAGLLNFFRIGSEALFVALYAVVLTAAVRAQPGTVGIADQVAAGQPGHGDVYTQALTPVLWGIGVVVVLLGVSFVALYRRAVKNR
ncbi:MFS transporter [Arthrobacter woluwensis]|uniref:Predicted arabinose efflux permease, MFS family n=1 Tax=Arthrobacter woluwensis TaxID=156980 RepID=A0A1H4RCR9_9MICC|nr:MFS transporter [Arthrobacter woluwensis]SEC29702.1 Predicted arabinose efflux permease, MFS family [Arthrobacter woluwensis]